MAEPLVRYSETQLENTLRSICVSGAEVANRQVPLAAAKIKVFQQSMMAFGKDTIDAPTGRLTQFEVAAAAGQPICDTTKFKNYFEATSLKSGIASAGLIHKINTHLSETAQLSDNATAADIRSRIPELREKLSSKLTLHDTQLDDQLTLDLIRAL